MNDFCVGAHVEFRPQATGALLYTGTIAKIVPYPSKWGDSMIHITLDGSGTNRIAFPDEVTVIP